MQVVDRLRAALQLSPLLLANAGVHVGASVSISTLETSGVTMAEAERVTLIYDAKGKAGKDSFFEAFVKEVVGAHQPGRALRGRELSSLWCTQSI